MTHRPSARARARLRELYERRLSEAEFMAGLRAPMGAAEREEIVSLLTWFRRRYRTPAERLAYVRQAYARWLAASTPAPAGPRGDS